MANRGGTVASMRVAVVGPCASGKTTLVEGLQRHGYDAYVCGQEHSEIPTLWRHGDPAAVIVLDIDLETVRRRRGADWPSALFATQVRRLRSARAAALAVIDAGRLSAADVLATAVTALKESPAPQGAPCHDEAEVGTPPATTTVAPMRETSRRSRDIM